MAAVPSGTYWGTAVSDMQEDLAVDSDDREITGTLKYLASGQLTVDWGEGNFMALKFTNNDTKVTSIKVGLNPSQGSGLVELDADMDGVFKVSDKDEQVFVIQYTDGRYVQTDTYDLSGLTLAGSGA